MTFFKQNHLSRFKMMFVFGALALLLCMTSSTVGAQAPVDVPDEMGQDGGLFLPYVQGGLAEPDPTSPEEPEEPEFPFELVATDLGSCPSGYHLVNKIGAFSVIDPADSDENSDWSDYGCRANQTLETAACGAYGTALLIGGMAACRCDAGYVGAACDTCGWGFAKDVETGQCVAQKQAAPVAQIEGGNESVEQGQTVALRAVAPSPDATSASVAVTPAVVNGVWSIQGGGGCLLTRRDASACVAQVNGSEAFFRAPSSGAPAAMTAVQFLPDSAPFSPIIQTVIVQPPGHIPVTGWGSPALQPIMERVVDYMVEHCIGAGVVGVAYYGKPVAMWGLGKNYGRASSAILDPLCGNDAEDPHFPGEPNITPDSPMHIGSVSKTISFAVARWALRQRLQELDTDIATVALSNQRLVTAIRTDENKLQLDSWQINGAGVVGHLDSDEMGAARDFSLARISDTRVLVGVRTQDGNLKVILWELDDSGQWTRLDDEQAGQIKQVRLAAINNNRVVAAVRQGNDTLQLIVWDAAPDGTLARLGDITAGRARDVDIADLSSVDGARVATAVHTENRSLKLIVWDVNDNGSITRRGEMSEAGPIGGLELHALTPQRVVTAIRTEAGNLKVIVWSVDANGAPTRQGDDEAGMTSHMALTHIGPSGFAVAVRTQGGNLKVISWLVDNQGEPTRRGDDEAGAVSSLAVASTLYGSETLQSVAFAAVRTQEGTLKIIPWDMTPTTPLRLTNAATGDVMLDYGWTDADIEALHLFGYDIPEGLLPEPLNGYFSGQVEVPVHFSAGESCPAPAQFADPQWQQITLKHLFGHRTGMPKSAVGDEVLMKDWIDELRELDSQADYAAQEQLMRDQWGNSNIEDSRALLGWNTNLVAEGATDGYLVPWITLDEVMTAVAGRCLPNDLTKGNYSNTTPQMIMRIMEHVSGHNYTALIGDPATHEGSLVDRFFAETLGVQTGPVAGVFARPQAVTTALDDIYPGPNGRSWDDGTYYRLIGDRKRPQCDWNGSSCSFSNWNNGAPRLTWGGAAENLPIFLTGNGYGAATGAMTVEVEEFLSFMTHYWTGGYDGDKPEAEFDPWIGEARNNVWNIDTHHNGSVGGGGHARADQIADAVYNIYGVDVFVAFNQNANKRCLENEDAPGCSDHPYTNVVQAGVREVDWDEVMVYGLQLAP